MKVRVELEVDIPWIKKAPNSFATLNSTLNGIKRDLPVRMSQANLTKIQIEDDEPGGRTMTAEEYAEAITYLDADQRRYLDEGHLDLTATCNGLECWKTRCRCTWMGG